MRAAAAATLFCGFVACAPAASPGPAPQSPLAALERAYQAARYWDDQRRLLESRGRDTTLEGFPGPAVRDSLDQARRRMLVLLKEPLVPQVSGTDALALQVMRTWEVELRGTGGGADTAGRALADLTDSIYLAYGRSANAIVFDGDTLNRVAVLGLLAQTPDRDRRERLFRALQPLWQSINGDDGPTSPYRRLVRLRRVAWGNSASPIERKGPAFGLPTAELEAWLVAALQRWRDALPDSLLEPWDWYFLTGEASRRLSPRLPRVADLRRVNDAYYLALGADPARLQVHFDLEPRAGKDPVAFTDFGIRNRWLNGRLVPGEPWVFTSYLTGGFDNLAELLHETGHAIHIAAIRSRPALLDWPDNDTFTEALADLPALELYEPAWQLRFLGDTAPAAASWRAEYSGTVLDMAWALFEIRVHRDPEADPNAVWTAITREYLRLRPHPEWSWWAMRGQLIDSPGYLINYALGAFLVADLRAAIETERGATAWFEPTMYTWLSQRIYRFGLERPSRDVLEGVLGRPLSPDALLQALGRARP